MRMRNAQHGDQTTFQMSFRSIDVVWQNKAAWSTMLDYYPIVFPFEHADIG